MIYVTIAIGLEGGDHRVVMVLLDVNTNVELRSAWSLLPSPLIGSFVSNRDSDVHVCSITPSPLYLSVYHRQIDSYIFDVFGWY